MRYDCQMSFMLAVRACYRLSRESTYPRSSRNRQMTLATISSFFSRPEPCVTLILVRAASFSDAVAPRHRAKSMVDDCAHTPTAQIRDARVSPSPQSRRSGVNDKSYSRSAS